MQLRKASSFSKLRLTGTPYLRNLPPPPARKRHNERCERCHKLVMHEAWANIDDLADCTCTMRTQNHYHDMRRHLQLAFAFLKLEAANLFPLFKLWIME